MGAVTMNAGRNVVHKRPHARPVVSIARIEAGRMLRHPAFLLALFVVAVAVASFPEDWVDGQFVAFTQAAVVAMGIGTLVASALVAGRERFVSEPDLFPGTPGMPHDRVLGSVLGLVGPALVAAVAMVVVGVRDVLTDGFVRGQEGYTRSTVPLRWSGPSLCSWWCWPASSG